MQIRQNYEFKRLLAPELRQSLKVLALPVLGLKNLVEEEVNDNPFLESSLESSLESLPPSSRLQRILPDWESQLDQLTQKASLEEILLRQLRMFTNSDEELKIGREIIGNIDSNGYLKADINEIAQALNFTVQSVEKVLKIIQKFEPQGVGARTIKECLLIQLDLTNEKDPLIREIVEFHLQDLARKKFNQIAKSLKLSRQEIEPLIKKILRLNPKPARNYSQEQIQRVVPDIIINEKGEVLEISINREDIPILKISKTYRDMLKRDNLDEKTREFLTDKLRNALELMRAISKRESTLRRVIEAVVEIQAEAMRFGLAHLEPLTFAQLASRLNIHESTVCRVVMNKYVKTPNNGIVALKDFFSSHIHDQNGQAVSSSRIKRLIKDMIDQEDKKHPLSDQVISESLSKQNSLNVSRRTVAKYREELKILSSNFRKER